MKKASTISIGILLLFPLLGKSQLLCGRTYKNFVPDSLTAIKIAEAILTPIYKNIEDEKPLRAKLIGDSVWYVVGSMQSIYRKAGVAEIKIRKSDGSVIYVCHGK